MQDADSSWRTTPVARTQPRRLTRWRGTALLGAALALPLLAAAAAHAADPPRAPGKPGTAVASRPAAGLQHFTLDPAHSTLEFRFRLNGNEGTGQFRRFTASLDWPAAAPDQAKLEVDIDVASLDTGDKDRDDTLRGADLFAVERFPRAHFTTTRLAPATSGAGTYLAQGSLQIRDRTRAVSLPLTLALASESGHRVGKLRGEITLRRLDYGVGQGDWQSTEWVDNEVVVRWDLRLEERP